MNITHHSFFAQASMSSFVPKTKKVGTNPSNEHYKDQRKRTDSPF
uniref:Uncharacterized protein n=1 Tax=Vibrio sp. FF_291 TaxID=1652832 RepID=A0A0H3ZVT7_9VIBR|nr:hypothetical protein [Vibrio sp. FF_291]